VAVIFAREGANVSIAYLPSEQPDAEDTKRMVEKEGGRCVLIPGDLCDFEQCKATVEKHAQEYDGVLHVLVNNASKQFMCNDLSEIDLEQVESTFRSNILGMFAVTKYALKYMKQGGSYVNPLLSFHCISDPQSLTRVTRIINTTSTVAFRGTPSMVDYAATKGAIMSFTRSLAAQLMPKGIRVNAVAPGPVHTPLQPASRPAEQMEKFGEHSGLGRIGQPSEIAPSFVFLASKDAELYYGQVLHAYPLGD
jgi:NAD(P)-dependent dehydrogenase (short-subunit alcohol dehydrogenase family)